MSDKRYQVAISFAGEQRPYAEAIATCLSKYGIAYFYDFENQMELWGRNLVEEFQQIYSERSQFVLMLISEHYVKKQWCRLERRSAIAEALRRDSEFILPVKFDDAWPAGMPTDMLFLDGVKNIPPEVAAMIARKLGISLFSTKASDIPPPKSTSWLSEVAFDYENFNGRYIIGDREHAFETRWSHATDGRIHVYNDACNINGVALAHGVSNFSDLADASTLDFTSRHRTAAEGEIVVFRNNNGLYSALKIEGVTARRGVIPAKLRFWYVINRDGSADFRNSSMFD